VKGATENWANLKRTTVRQRIRAKRNQGVAVITALLLATLAITLVSSLFWQQQVQVRSIENQRLQLQKQWVLRGALDWARLILREDAKYSASDDLNEPWAVPLSETRLDRYVEAAAIRGEAGNAVLSGSIQDAQARFNLSSLATQGEVNIDEVQVLERLLSLLRQDPALGRGIAQQVAASQRSAENQQSRPIAFIQVDDLLAVPGCTLSVLSAIRDEVVFLPRATAVNVNTASAAVLSARWADLSMADAVALVGTRRNAGFKNMNEFMARVPGKASTPEAGSYAVATDFFLVNGRVAIAQASLQIQALVERSGASTRLLWLREI
jgi:general secretion pathway protein K